MPGGKVVFANSLRGMAALIVVFSHYFAVFWLARPVVAEFIQAAPLPATVETPAIVQLISYSPVNLGAFGVALFFLISGFVVPFSLTKRATSGFLLGRLVRLAPTYACGFGLCVAAIALSAWFYGRGFPYAAEDVLLHFVIGLRDVLNVPNIDGIIWTLEIEVKFYLLCALVAPWLRRVEARAFLAPLAVALVCAVANWGIRSGLLAGHLVHVLVFSGQFLVFMFIGVAAHFVHRGQWSRRQGALAGLACFLAFAALWAGGAHSDSAWQIGSYATAVAVFVLAFARPNWVPDTRVIRFLADISYPLYVMHGLAGYVTLRLLLHGGAWPMPALALTTALALGVAWGLHRWVEAPSQRLGQSLARGASMPGRRAAALPPG